MAYYYSIPIEEMEEELESLRFYPVNLVFRNKPVKEWVYERKLPRSENHFVRVYTGINRYGQSAGESRKSGKDAIRIQVIYRDAKGETLVSQTKRVHRVGGWRKNLHKRMNEVSSELPQVEFDSRGEPMTLRKKGKNNFWGSRDYPKFKETKPFASEDEVEEWGGIPIIDLNSIEDLEEFGLMVGGKRWINRNRDIDIMDNNFFRITCDGVYAVRTIWGPSKTMFGQNMLASNLIPFNHAMQYGLSGVWKKLYVDIAPRGPRSIGIVSAYGPFDKNMITKPNKSLHDPSSMEGWIPFVISGNTSASVSHKKNTIIIDMKGIVFAYEGQQGEIEFYGGVPESSIVSQEIPPESVNPNKISTNFTLPVIGDVLRDADVKDFNKLLQPLSHKILTRWRRGKLTTDDKEILSLKGGLYLPTPEEASKMTVKQLREVFDKALPRRILPENSEKFWKRINVPRSKQEFIDILSHPEITTDEYIQYWNQFAAEEIRCCKECDKTTGLTTIQAGTYCYDCLPINLGAEEEEINIIDLNSKKEIREYGLFESYQPNPSYNEEQRRRSLTDAPENNNLFRITCDGVYAVRTIYGPSKILFGRNMLASNKISFNHSIQSNLSGVWGLMGLPRNHSGVVSAYGPLTNLNKMPKSMKKPVWGGINEIKGLTPNTIVINMKGLVFAYDIMNREVEFYGGVPQSSIVSEEIPPEWVNTQDYAHPHRGQKIRASTKDYTEMSDYNFGNKWDRKQNLRLQQGIQGQMLPVPDEEYIAYFNQFAAESPDWDDIDWETDEPPKKEGWEEEINWDAESYLERDTRIRRERDIAYYGDRPNNNNSYNRLIHSLLNQPLIRYGHRIIKKFNTPEEFQEFLNLIRNRSDLDFADSYVFICDFDWYVKRITNNPIYTLYGNIVPLSNFSSGWSDRTRRDTKLMKRYGAPIFVQSPKYGKMFTNLKDLRKIKDIKRSSTSMIGDGLKDKLFDEEKDSVLIINMKGLKFANGNDYLRGFSDIMVLGGLPIENVVGYMYNEPEYLPLKGGQHHIITMDREDFKRRMKAEESGLKEFDDTTADDFVKDSDDQITLMLRKKSKINKYGDIGCPVCGSIGLFSGEIIAKGKKWYCFECLYEDKTETIKSRGDITLEKYGLVVTCPVCKNGIKAYNQDSMLRHIKKCGVSE